MELFKDSALILFAAPFYLVLIVAEIVAGHLHGRPVYSARGTATNVLLAAVNVALDVALRGAWFAALAWAYGFRFGALSEEWLYWPALLVLQDLAFYFLHRVDHACRLFWAVHVTHHSSPEFNLTVGFRPSVFQPVYRFAWFLPLAVLGFRPEDVLLMYSVTQLYGVLVHTQCVGRLGVLERVLCTPSHHRVHHGTNPQYLDRNFGMVFIVWDRLFGTFAAEGETVRFGVAGVAPTHDPARVLFCEWGALWRDLRRATSARSRWAAVFGPPGGGLAHGPEYGRTRGAL